MSARSLLSISILLANVALLALSVGGAVPTHLPASTRSATGDVVAFTRHGDLYTKALPSGIEQRLTRNGNCVRPEWSPSGRWIACLCATAPYKRPEGLKFVRRDGRIVRFVKGIDAFVWKSRAEEALFTDLEGNLSRLDLNTGTIHLFTLAVPSGASTAVEDFRWSPDGQYMAYKVRDAEKASQTDGPNISLWTARRDGSDARCLYTSAGHDFVPEIARWSPDSRYLLYWTPYAGASASADGVPFYASSRRGGRPLLLPGNKGRDVVLMRPSYLAFRNKDSSLAISAGNSRFFIENKRIYLGRLEHSGSLTHQRLHVVTPTGQAAISPVWSPDGSKIAYLGAPSRQGAELLRPMGPYLRQMRVWVMNSNGTHRHRLPSEQVEDTCPPVWLSDGHHLLFETTNDNTQNELWIGDTDGNPARCVVSGMGSDDSATYGDGQADKFSVLTRR